MNNKIIAITFFSLIALVFGGCAATTETTTTTTRTREQSSMYAH
jgi:hypothetical protein